LHKRTNKENYSIAFLCDEDVKCDLRKCDDDSWGEITRCEKRLRNRERLVALYLFLANESGDIIGRTHISPNRGCGYQSLTTDALKRLIDQLKKKILQIDQSKITVKHL